MTMAAHMPHVMTELPPHAIEAEVGVLGSIFVDPACLPDIRKILPDPEWFFRPAHQEIYRTMLEVADESDGAIDIVMLNQRMIDDGTLKIAGGIQYLTTIASEFPSATNAKHYARMVREKHWTFVALGALSDAYLAIQSKPSKVLVQLGQTVGKLQVAMQEIERHHRPSPGQRG